MSEKQMKRHGLAVIAGAVLLAALPLGNAWADQSDPDDGTGDTAHPQLQLRSDPSAALMEHDAATEGIVSEGPFADVVKNLSVAGRGERLQADATTDVWALDGYSYTGTFSSPCGGSADGDAGIWVWDVRNANNPEFVTVIASPTGSRSNDVKVANMNSGRILVHSNESCGGGPGGFEIYNVDDPSAPAHLAHVQTDDINAFLRDALGFVDFGVHNLFLFSQGAKDYVGAVVESEFGNFQIFDITDPAAPVLVSGWGAESLEFPGVDFATLADFGAILDADAYLFSGFGASANRFLHDITISADGTKAYLANWDAGLVLLDISDPASPALVSVAIDPDNGSLDGEVNSHAVWPSEDGTIVVEGEEDFSVFAGDLPLGNFTFQERSTNTIFGVGISTNAGTEFENSQTGNIVTITASSVTVDSGPLAGTAFAASEGSGDQPKLGGGSVSGEAVWIGRACNGDPVLNAASFDAGDIAVVRRGGCFFGDKLANAAALGAAAIVVSNNQPDTVWSGARIWDYSDPANPVLASTVNTVCSASPGDESCDPRGTYSLHNVIVETNDDGRVKAYLSWYTDGVVILDVSDPYMPLETARYHREGEDFEAENGGIQDIWGIYKEPGKPWIYASDRNGGLYMLKEYGWGSSKVAKK